MKILEMIRRKRTERAQATSSDWWSTVERLAKSDKPTAADADAVEALLAETGRDLAEFERDLQLVRDVIDAEAAAKGVPGEAVFERRETELASREASLAAERAALEARQRDAQKQIDADRAVLRTEAAVAKKARDRLATAKTALDARRDPQPPKRVLTPDAKMADGLRYGHRVQEALKLARDLQELRGWLARYRENVGASETVIDLGNGNTAVRKPARPDEASEQNVVGRIARAERDLDRVIGELREFRSGFDEIDEPAEWQQGLAAAGV